jgi:hypothetical protein
MAKYGFNIEASQTQITLHGFRSPVRTITSS